MVHSSTQFCRLPPQFLHLPAHLLDLARLPHAAYIRTASRLITLVYVSVKCCFVIRIQRLQWSCGVLTVRFLPRCHAARSSHIQSSGLFARLLRGRSRPRYLLLPSITLIARYTNVNAAVETLISDTISALKREEDVLVDPCFLHWYTPSLFTLDVGASRPSRSIGSN